VTLRTRIASLVAITVTVLLLVTGAALQAITANTLVGAVDADLRAIAENLERDPRGAIVHAGPGRGRLGGAAGVVQVVGEQGRIDPVPSAALGRGMMRGPAETADLPVGDDDLAIARGELPASLRTVAVDGVRLRVLTAPLGEGFAVQVARPLDEVESVIAALRGRTALLTLAGALLAAAIAWTLAGRSIRPVRALTEAVEQVRDGRDLTRRDEVRAGSEGHDEVARLAAAFDAMLVRLDTSRVAQEQLAADASHELRTPLTSLRTNVEVLAHDAARLDADDRRRLSEDVIVQIEELTAMVDGLVSLTRVDTGATAHVEVDLSDLLEDVVETSRRRHPQRANDLTLRTSVGVDDHVIAVGRRPEPVVVHGNIRELTLAISAMLDNAVKYTEDGEIVVESAPDEDAPGHVLVSVCDAGPGVDPEHLPHLFARFYRTPEARARPGAGLGLALVERVARAHGGTVGVANVTHGGLKVTVRLPVGHGG
jgi:two-component system sensor histidine kinase MprB